MCLILTNLFIWSAGELEICIGRISQTDNMECTLILLKQVDSLLSSQPRCFSRTRRSFCLVLLLEDCPVGFTQACTAVTLIQPCGAKCSEERDDEHSAFGTVVGAGKACY